MDIAALNNPPKLAEVEFAGMSETGAIRSDNQDAILVPDSPLPGLFAFLAGLADGMGGYASGDIASKLALSTVRQVILDSNLPWLKAEDATARLICDVYTPDGQPFQGDPRSVLRRAIAASEQMGFRYNTGPELEFFLLKPNPDGSLIPPVPQPLPCLCRHAASRVGWHSP